MLPTVSNPTFPPRNAYLPHLIFTPLSIYHQSSPYPAFPMSLLLRQTPRHLHKLKLTPALSSLKASSRVSISRTMASTSAPAKFEWLVVLPDKEGALERRLSVRPYVICFWLSLYWIQACLRDCLEKETKKRFVVIWMSNGLNKVKWLTVLIIGSILKDCSPECSQDSGSWVVSDIVYFPCPVYNDETKFDFRMLAGRMKYHHESIAREASGRAVALLDLIMNHDTMIWMGFNLSSYRCTVVETDTNSFV